MKWLTRMVLLLLLQGATAPGCKSAYECPAGLEHFSCALTATPKASCQAVCGDAGAPPAGWVVCASNENDAASLTSAHFIASPWDVQIRYCYSLAGAPVGFKPQTVPSCEASETDNACVVCAKDFCCDLYQACAGDAVCLCWVGCKYAGNADAVCAQPDNCGPLDGVSASAAACLDAHCPSACGGMETMAGACMCGGSTSIGSSSGGGAGPSCTPGPTGSGEPCFSDGDCASCLCNTQTMTCG